MNFAAKNGHLEVVEWLNNNIKEGCKTCATNSMYLAADNGHLEIVEYLKKVEEGGKIEFSK
jgi:hypothetical protein